MTGSTKLLTAGGGGVTIQPSTSIASDVTVNVPSQNCTLGIQGPAFSATPSGTQSVSNSTWTKVLLGTEGFDTNNNFASSTFTPTVAGYYQLNGYTQINATGVFVSHAVIYKNGTAIASASTYAGNDYPKASTSVLTYANGTTDYFDLYTRQDSGLSQNLTTSSFSGALVRAA